VDDAPRVPGVIADAILSEHAIELVGVSQPPASEVPTPVVEQMSSPRPWALILTAVTFAVDLVAVTLSIYLARIVARGDGWGSLSAWPIFVTVAVWPVVFAIYGLYDLRRPALATQLQRLMNAVLMSVLLVVLITFVARIEISRSFVVWLLVFSMVGVVAGRLAVRRLRHALNAHAVTGLVTLIAGTNGEARALARTLRRRPWMGHRVCGFVEDEPSGCEVMDGLPVFGTVDNIATISADNGVRSVIIAGSAARGSTLQFIDSALNADVAIRVSPGMANLGAARVILEPIDGMALISLRRHRFSRRQRLVKRSLDITVTTVALVIFAVPMVVIAAAIRLTSPGPAVFRQRRVGENEREFRMFKFRTMVVGAHAQRDGLENEADGLLFKIRRDPRVTKVGRLLRRTSLDELPQLFNVLGGSMSLVGPRPALPEEASCYAEDQRGRLRVKPGVTGLWQVNGRHDLAFEDYLRYDLFYVENWSLTLDLYILAKTIPALLTAHGSY
jgi:exopolysaccharide biosynthesis polyprenyl glycosylphosphotransferase